MKNLVKVPSRVVEHLSTLLSLHDNVYTNSSKSELRKQILSNISLHKNKYE